MPVKTRGKATRTGLRNVRLGSGFGGSLRLLRIVVSLLALGVLTVGLTAVEAGTLRAMGWVQSVQIVPLILAGAASGLVLWVLVTVLFGRIYCSSVCPMGTLMDIAARSRRYRIQWLKRYPYHYAAPRNTLRFTVAAAVVLCGLLGAMAVVSLFDPFDSYSRIADEFIRPVREWVGGRQVVISSWLSFGLAAVTLIVAWVCAARSGRILCNTLCPVGAGLGALSAYSLWHFDIDTDLCTNCRKCEYVCKAQCINLNDHVVDSSRCVVCFDCTDVCPDGAIRYTPGRKNLSIPMMQRVERPNAAMDSNSVNTE